MPAGPGESLLATLFADVHYQFNDPTAKPQHHRFSRGSYVYLYYSSTQQRGKIEIANHAGTPDQDAFNGYLDAANLAFSYKQPGVIMLTVVGQIQGHDTWHLPSFDEKNQHKYLYKIHTLDLYMWSEKDATTMLGHLKTVMPVDSQQITGAPAPSQPQQQQEGKPGEHRDSMSPVVQQLERTAVGTSFPARTESTASTHSFPGPPGPSASAGASAQQVAPMAYNPAAPAAPEPIAHREKTPPPPEDGSGHDPSHTTQYAGIPNTFGPPTQATPQQQYFSGPPSHPQQQHSFPGPPGQQQAPSFPGPPQGTSPSGMQRNHSGSLPPPPPGGPSPAQRQQYNPSFGPQATSPPPTQQSFGPGQTQFASYTPQPASGAPTPSFGPQAMASPGFAPQSGTPLQSPGLPQQQGHSYVNYTYQPGSGTPGTGGYDLHTQAYRPTESEEEVGRKEYAVNTRFGQLGSGSRTNSGGSGGLGGAPSAGGAQQGHEGGEARQGLGERVSGVERRVGKFLKGLDRKI